MLLYSLIMGRIVFDSQKDSGLKPQLYIIPVGIIEQETCALIK